MPKRSKKSIVQDERKIMAELQKNSQESFDTIAKRCGCSRQKVWRFVNRIEKNHSIWGYTAIVNYEKQELKHFTLLMKRALNPINEKTVDNITSRRIEKIASNFGITVESSFYVHGRYDWILTFTAPDIKQAKKICDMLIRLNPRVIEQTVLLETLFFVKRNHILNPDVKKLKEFL
jgi:DNA-binding Lrp family transcriptional regulator